MQLIIDSSKRMYEVDAIAEIDRIKRMDCMKREKDFPEFMKYTRSVEMTKHGKELPYEDIANQRIAIRNRIDRTLTCPMNHLQEWLDKIQGSSQAGSIPVADFLVRIPGKPKYEQMTKIMKIIDEFEAYTRRYLTRPDNGDFVEEYYEEYDNFIAKIGKIKIGNPVTINRMILSAMSIDDANNPVRAKMGAHTRKIMNSLFRTNPEKFFMSFRGKTGET